MVRPVVRSPVQPVVHKALEFERVQVVVAPAILLEDGTYLLLEDDSSHILLEP